MRAKSLFGLSAATLSFLILAAPAALARDRDRDRDSDGGGLDCRAKLSGANEVTTPPGGVVTDTTGRAKVRFNADASKATFELRVNDGVNIRQAHIHCGAADINGPIVAFLAGLFGGPGLNNAANTAQDVDGNWIDNATLTARSVLPRTAGTASSQCPAAVNSLADIAGLARVNLAYVNVHSDLFPGGVIRGQLVCKEDDDD